MCITRLGQKSNSFLRGGGREGAGWGWEEGGADSASTLLTLRTVYVYLRNVGQLDVLYALTINGGTGITGPQQTNRNSLIIIFYT